MKNKIQKDDLIDEIHNYLLRVKKQQSVLKSSIRISSRELMETLRTLRQTPNAGDLAIFIRDVIGSSAWIANNSLRLIGSFSGSSKYPANPVNQEIHRFVLEKVSQNIKIDPIKYPPAFIFKVIYEELMFAHDNPKYKTNLKLPKIFPTIVLVSGVLNEIYKTAAFERGVSHLSRINGLKYIVAKTHGLRSAEYNSEQIHNQIMAYHKHHPDEKYWLVSFSKGGVDSLHYLKNSNEWAQKNVVGLSTIATPILGSKHVNKSWIRLANQLIKPNNRQLYLWRYLAEMQDTLSYEKQSLWFRQNFSLLPDNIFYTALGFQSHWMDSHIYMMATKLILPSDKPNDGVVDTDLAFFPSYFKATNLGIMPGHHLVGARSSSYGQEALIASHIILLKYLNVV